MSSLISHRCLIVFIIPVSVSCSAVIGPHHIKTGNQEGVRVIHLEGYGCNMLNLRDTTSLHLGWYRRTVVFENDDSQEGDVSSRGFSVFRVLPEGLPVHHAVTDVGVTATWEPCFRGISLGFQSRSLSRLPMNRSLILEVHKIDDEPNQFSLHRLP